MCTIWRYSVHRCREAESAEQPGSRERRMLVLSLLPHFLQSLTPAKRMVLPHEECVFPPQPDLEMLIQTHPEVCLLSASRSCPVGSQYSPLQLLQYSTAFRWLFLGGPCSITGGVSLFVWLVGFYFLFFWLLAGPSQVQWPSGSLQSLSSWLSGQLEMSWSGVLGP